MCHLILHMVLHKNCYNNLRPKIRVSFDTSSVQPTKNRYPMLRHALSTFFHWINETGAVIHF